MPGSVGPIKLPIVSTFDASGLNQARAGLKELERSNAAAGGGGGGPAPTAPKPKPTPPSPPKSAGFRKFALDASQAGGTLASASGLGGLSAAMGAAGPIAAIATAGVALYALTQSAAANAQATRAAAANLRVSDDYYAGMANAARKAHIEIGEVTTAFGRFSSAVKNAASGADFGTAMYLRSAGLSQEDVIGGGANPEQLVGKLGTAQRWMMFGSARATDAAAAAQNGTGGGMFDQKPQSTWENSQLKTGAGNFLSNLLGIDVNNSKAILNGNSADDQWQHDNQERLAEESRERMARFLAAQSEGGRKLAGALATPEETAATQRESIKGFIYSEGDAENERYRRLANLQTVEGVNAARRAQRSNAENLTADISAGNERWDIESNHSTTNQKYVARSIGDQLTEYVEGLTSSGAQAGAYGVNTVQGASQLMGAEYRMDQALNTKRMVELLLKIAENTGHLKPGATKDIEANLGYRTNDPISGLWGQ